MYYIMGTKRLKTTTIIAIGSMITLAFASGEHNMKQLCGLPVHKPSLVTTRDNITGLRGSGGMRITGGVRAVAHSHPWHVLLHSGGAMWCSGALISTRWLVTAAHCMYAHNLRVWLGVHDRRELAKAQRAAIAQVLLHPHFDLAAADPESGRPFYADIALVQLADEALFTDTVLPICLPEPAEDNWRKDGGYVVATGWGRAPSFFHGTDILRQVVLRCDLRRCGRVQHGRLHDTEMCASRQRQDTGTGTGGDTCRMDSGGPLIDHRRARYVLAGVTSRGLGDCRTVFNGVYTHVPHYVQWIRRHVDNV